ncbi:hypothetical protein G7Y31_02295 [Corynebacterium lizhenjunii]|uniref:Secreted protein n=1 Tax=Corynebacterium lizhenjunii TaxID=2709394 RepID=A0A7T0PCB7_9CORY|nr:hypothetical protein [Corynebacterium lizhenjunii]QPK79562.1 hypothetical protein G7Y31_02295 [Corynebacterium lizhenjunii]
MTFRKCLMTIVVSATVFILGPLAVPAGAGPADKNRGTAIGIEDLSAWETEATFEALERYVHLGHDIFDYSGASRDPMVEEELLEEYAAVLMVEGWQIQGTASELVGLTEKAELHEQASIAFRAACGGRNGFQAAPPAVLLDSCAATALQNAYAAGSGVAGLAALITSYTGAGPLIAGSIASMMVIASGLVGVCNSWGRGIKVFATGGCWSQ